MTIGECSQKSPTSSTHVSHIWLLVWLLKLFLLFRNCIVQMTWNAHNPLYARMVQSSLPSSSTGGGLEVAPPSLLAVPKTILHVRLHNHFIFFWSGRTHNGSLTSKDQGPFEGVAPTDAAALFEPRVHCSHMSAKLPSVGLGLRKGFALPIDGTAFFSHSLSGQSVGIDLDNSKDFARKKGHLQDVQKEIAMIFK